MDLWQSNTNQIIKAFLYGDPGAGKTTLCWSSVLDPRTRPVIWMNCAGNPESVQKKTPAVDLLLNIKATKDIDAVYDWLDKGQPEKHPLVAEVNAASTKATGKPFKWPEEKFKMAVLDGITEFQRIRNDEIVGNTGRKPADALNAMEIQHHGRSLQTLTYVARLFYTGLPEISVMITCLEKTDVDKEGTVVSYSPALWGQGKFEVPAYSLLTMRIARRDKMLAVDKTKVDAKIHTVAYTDQVTRFLAKDQYSSLPRIIEDPTVPKIMDAIYGPASA